MIPRKECPVLRGLKGGFPRSRSELNLPQTFYLLSPWDAEYVLGYESAQTWASEGLWLMRLCLT